MFIMISMIMIMRIIILMMMIIMTIVIIVITFMCKYTTEVCQYILIILHNPHPYQDSLSTNTTHVNLLTPGLLFSPSPGSASASTHPSLAVVTGSSVDRGGGGDESTPPDMSNHSRSSSKKSNHSIHSVHNGMGE